MTREEHNAYSREWVRKNPDKRREIARRWRLKHGDRVHAQRRAYRAANREKMRLAKERWIRENPDRVAVTQALAKARRKRLALASDLRVRYDFTLKDYESLLTAQGHRCAICGRVSGNDHGDRLFIDHDHDAGAVRGLLCNRCNSALGYFGDSPKRLRRAAAYLENWRGKTCPDALRGFQPILECLSETGSALRRPQSVEPVEPLKRTG